MWAVVLTIDKSKFGCTRFVCKQAFTRSFVQTFGTCFAPSRCYACDILRSLRALPLTTGRNAWAWHDSLRSNMYHAFSCALLGSSLCRATLPFV